MLKQILIGVFIIAIGILFTWKTQVILDMVGVNQWAERNFGGGGSRMLYKLVGIVIVVVGALYMTGFFSGKPEVPSYQVQQGL